jgi:hypothetical protein
MEDCFNHNHDAFFFKTHRWALGNASPFGIHTFLFMPFLKQQCSDEQYKFWVPLAESGKILGAYCQTELGHGTHVGGIEVGLLAFLFPIVECFGIWEMIFPRALPLLVSSLLKFVDKFDYA